MATSKAQLLCTYLNSNLNACTDHNKYEFIEISVSLNLPGEFWLRLDNCYNDGRNIAREEIEEIGFYRGRNIAPHTLYDQYEKHRVRLSHLGLPKIGKEKFKNILGIVGEKLEVKESIKENQLLLLF